MFLQSFSIKKPKMEKTKTVLQHSCTLQSIRTNTTPAVGEAGSATWQGRQPLLPVVRYRWWKLWRRLEHRQSRCWDQRARGWEQRRISTRIPLESQIRRTAASLSQFAFSTITRRRGTRHSFRISATRTLKATTSSTSFKGLQHGSLTSTCPASTTKL